MKNQLSHIDASGAATMVDVTVKPDTQREARASATVTMNAQAMQQLIAGNNKKGDVLGVARIAGIQAAKKCSDLIPLCHPLALTGVQVDFAIDETANSVNVNTGCKVKGGTGVEMEALCAATVAALTIYDMCKAVDKSIVISEVALLEKTGGKGGHWVRAADE
ncbi:cyclic pyranopterin monophosphate synthase MoaC [Pseudomonadales bacterium]|jgi:cyclic pyranopterin phosphate synthase|nr:cyclic pyranopterin monophosphate synthase MoaC [Pseudomonadales bacterium]MDB4450836.1 cyclic pyranopterin monophosphate synthase MoaC [Pseudomonadales bacterium]MDB4493321.1 cyclic pyranopterin monophosphate synthase MoaC [Pseudomonadales bacterium]MDB4630879.1 cyclic pyranopterin monophosphate synthase MoaC [Pseudomonadales bacterium]